MPKKIPVAAPEAPTPAAPRTRKDIDQEYSHWAARYGDLGYKIEALKEDHELMRGRMKELNQEARLLELAQAAAQ